MWVPAERAPTQSRVYLVLHWLTKQDHQWQDGIGLRVCAES